MNNLFPLTHLRVPSAKSDPNLLIRWNKHQAVKKHIEAGKSPDLSIINTTLFSQPRKVI